MEPALKEEVKDTLWYVTLTKWMENISDQVRHIPELKVMLASACTSQRAADQAIKSFSETYKRSEERQSRNDDRMETVLTMLISKNEVPENYVPYKTHVWTVAICLVPAVLMAAVVFIGILWITSTNFEGSIHEIKLITNRLQSKADLNEKTVKRVEAAVEQIKDGKE